MGVYSVNRVVCDVLYRDLILFILSNSGYSDSKNADLSESPRTVAVFA